MTPLSGRATGRLTALDVLKGACIVLVVFNHTLLWPMRAGDLPSAFLYGTAFGTVAAFAAIAGFLRGRRPPVSEAEGLRRRARQLLLPWAIAAPLYAVAPLVWRLAGGPRLPIGFEPLPWAREILLGGGPLWFLPVLFAAQAVCSIFIRRTRSWWPAIGAVAVYAALAITASLSGISPLALGRGTFWAVAPLYVAAFWFGVRLAEDGLRVVRTAPGVVLVIATMGVSGAVTLLRTLHPDATWLMWLPYAIGLAGGCLAVAVAVDWPSAGRLHPVHASAVRALVRAGRASMGIYILHPLLVAPAVLALAGRGGAFIALVVAVAAVALGTLLVERAVVAA